MPVAYEVAMRLNLLLDVFIVGKLGIPGYEELAMGAIASGGVRVVNADVVRHLPRAENYSKLRRRKRRQKSNVASASTVNGRPPRELRGCTVILINDGLATGSTMSAAVLALRQREAAKIVVAVPVGSPETCSEFEREVDETICAIEPETFYAVGQF